MRSTPRIAKPRHARHGPARSNPAGLFYCQRTSGARARRWHRAPPVDQRTRAASAASGPAKGLEVSRTRQRGPRIQDTGYRIQDTGPADRTSGPEDITAPDPCFLDPAARARFPAPWILNPEQLPRANGAGIMDHATGARAIFCERALIVYRGYTKKFDR